MRIAAISLLTASDAFNAQRGAHAQPDNGGQGRALYERRRRSRDIRAQRLSPVNRMDSGLAIQVIAQIARVENAHSAIENARAVYGARPAPHGQKNLGATVNLRV